MPISREKFIKLMGMTTSIHDGECLNAIRMANAMLASANMNWREFIENRLPSSGEMPPQYEKFSGPKVDAMFATLLERIPQHLSFRRFVEDVYSFYERMGFLTEKQYEAIKRAADAERR